MDLSTKRVHQDFPVGFLVEADAHHVDVAVDPEMAASETQCGSPLTGAGFGDDAFYRGLFVVVRVRDGRIRLMRATGAGSFVLVVNLTICSECLFQVAGPDQGGRPPYAVGFLYFIWNIDIPLCRYLLLDECHGED